MNTLKLTKEQFDKIIASQGTMWIQTKYGVSEAQKIEVDGKLIGIIEEYSECRLPSYLKNYFSFKNTFIFLEECDLNYSDKYYTLIQEIMYFEKPKYEKLAVFTTKEEQKND